MKSQRLDEEWEHKQHSSLLIEASSEQSGNQCQHALCSSMKDRVRSQ